MCSSSRIGSPSFAFQSTKRTFDKTKCVWAHEVMMTIAPTAHLLDLESIYWGSFRIHTHISHTVVSFNVRYMFLWQICATQTKSVRFCHSSLRAHGDGADEDCVVKNGSEWGPILVFKIPSSGSTRKVITKLLKREEEIVWVSGRLDARLWLPNEMTESHTHIYIYIYSNK